MIKMEKMSITPIKAVIYMSLILTFCYTQAIAKDFTIPIKVIAGTSRTNLIIAIEEGSSNGYDEGRDIPYAIEEEAQLKARFNRANWGVVIGGKNIQYFSRESRSGIPQYFEFEIETTQTPVTIKWDNSQIPKGINAVLRDNTNYEQINLRTQSKYEYQQVLNPAKMTIELTEGDTSAPYAPQNLKAELKDEKIYITWDSNTEEDLAGYKISFGKESGNYKRTINIKNVNNYNLTKIEPDTTYYIALKAYDNYGNESAYSQEISIKTPTATETEDPQPEKKPLTITKILPQTIDDTAVKRMINIYGTGFTKRTEVIIGEQKLRKKRVINDGIIIGIIPNLPAGTYTIQLTNPNGEKAILENALTITSSKKTIKIKVLDENDATINNCQLEIRGKKNSDNFTCNQNGEITIYNLNKGTYYLTVVADGYKSTSLTINVADRDVEKIIKLKKKKTKRPTIKKIF